MRERGPSRSSFLRNRSGGDPQRVRSRITIRPRCGNDARRALAEGVLAGCFPAARHSLPDAVDERTFHQRAIAEGRFYQERVAGQPVGSCLRAGLPRTSPVRSPMADAGRRTYARSSGRGTRSALSGFCSSSTPKTATCCRSATTGTTTTRSRNKVRDDIGRRKDQGRRILDHRSPLLVGFRRSLPCHRCLATPRLACHPTMVACSIGCTRAAALARVRLGDAAMADVIDALSFERTPARPPATSTTGTSAFGSSVRSMSVCLSRKSSARATNIVVRPNVFARKDSGSYYTPDDLVGLIVRGERSDLWPTSRMEHVR